MRPFSGTEKGFLTLAALMIVCGGWMVLFPSEVVVGHAGYSYKMRLPPWVEHRSVAQTRVYGGLAGAMGAGFVGLVFYRRK
jgi:hypothetical protein